MSSRPVRIAVLVAGIAAGIALGPASEYVTRADVLPPVLAVGLALPAGWLGLDALRRR